MQSIISLALFVGFVLVVAMVAVAPAGEFNQVVSIGDAAPDVAGTGVDDEETKLADYQGAKAIVLVFTCNGCPVAVAYEDRLVALQKDYAEKGVQVLAVNVNATKGDTLELMKKKAASKEFNFPYIRDDSQASAKAYGATTTPHAFLLDGDRKIVYMGAIDNSKNASAVENNYLRDAIDALLAGETIETTETRQFGCGIKWAKK
jgi:peroxiredoxin